MLKSLPIFLHYLRCSQILPCSPCTAHYPQISTDMLQRVQERRPSHNNASRISQSSWLSWCKLCYYYAFALCYGFVGRFAALVMVNSSWTQRHIHALWKVRSSLEPRHVMSLLWLVTVKSPSRLCTVSGANGFGFSPVPCSAPDHSELTCICEAPSYHLSLSVPARKGPRTADHGICSVSEI